MAKRFSPILLGMLIMLSISCKKDDPHHEHENENINQVKINFKDEHTSLDYLWTLNSSDTIFLQKNTSYDVSISFLHEESQHEHDLTDEIREEAENHQVQISSTPSNVLQIEYKDFDKNNLILGLSSKIETLQDANGQLRIVLKHYNGNKNNPSAGSTDVDVQFPLIIQ